MRTINFRAFKKYKDKHGNRGLIELSYRSQVSYSMIEKLARGKYSSLPKEEAMGRLASYLGLSIDDLFPPAPKRGAGR